MDFRRPGLQSPAVGAVDWPRILHDLYYGTKKTNFLWMTLPPFLTFGSLLSPVSADFIAIGPSLGQGEQEDRKMKDFNNEGTEIFHWFIADVFLRRDSIACLLPKISYCLYFLNAMNITFLMHDIISINLMS